MARSRVARVPTGEPSPFNIVEDPADKLHKQDLAVAQMESDDQESDVASDVTNSSEEEEREISELVLEDMEKFEESFKGITKQYRLINRIGEGRVCQLGVLKSLLKLFSRNLLDCIQS